MVTTQQFTKTNSLIFCMACRGRTQGQHYLLHVGTKLKLALQGAASQTSYKSPGGHESADSDAVGLGWDLRFCISHKLLVEPISLVWEPHFAELAFKDPRNGPLQS